MIKEIFEKGDIVVPSKIGRDSFLQSIEGIGVVTNVGPAPYPIAVSWAMYPKEVYPCMPEELEKVKSVGLYSETKFAKAVQLFAKYLDV